MKIHIFNKLNNKFIYILLLFIFVYTIITLSNNSYGATYTYTKDSNDLPSDFDSKYPNYRILINTLVSEHPNWKFKLYETALDWNTVLDKESVHGRNLVQPGHYTHEWGCSCNVAYDGPWKCASKESIRYMMDPRNFLNSYDVFQFQDLTASNGDKSAIVSMVSGTFMNGKEECIQAIMDSANTNSISPYFITSKILQEQGNNGSVLSLGEGFDVNKDGTNEYVGYYNFFNINAYDDENASAIENGLKYAQQQGWDSMYKSIMAGAKFIKNSYMEVGQTTPYFQKYNVVYSKYLYQHQYMTNIWGAYSEGKGMRAKYIKNNIYENSFTFTIPLYSGMPEMKDELIFVNANPSLKLKAGPAQNSEHLLSINYGTIILRNEKATQKVDGYYWDKVITPYGKGYMARAASDDSKLYLVPLTLVSPINTPIDVNGNNNFTDPDSNNIICTEPNTTVSNLKSKYINATIVDKDNQEITEDTLVGTGTKIKIDGEEKYTIVKMGDVNGDGKITPSDYVKISNHIMKASTLTGIYLTASDINKDETITPADYVKVSNHIMGSSKISL